MVSFLQNALDDTELFSVRMAVDREADDMLVTVVQSLQTSAKLMKTLVSINVANYPSKFSLIFDRAQLLL